jgi:putative component of toxin-antitoxin plasmid stabilization module
MFFFVKMKLGHCREAMKELRSAKSVEKIDKRFRRLAHKDIQLYKSQHEVKPFETYFNSFMAHRVGLYRLSTKFEHAKSLKQQIYKIKSLVKLSRIKTGNHELRAF